MEEAQNPSNSVFFMHHRRNHLEYTYFFYFKINITVPPTYVVLEWLHFLAKSVHKVIIFPHECYIPPYHLITLIISGKRQIRRL
jgi:hypothetical protein